MAKRKLNQYKSFLTASQVAEGMNIALHNAARLHADAKLLFEKQRYPSSVALAILSIEESGKLSILRSLALAREQQEVAAEWRGFRSHTRKNILWPFLDMVKQGARKFSDFRPLVEPDAEHPYLLDNIKQLCLYTDCLGKARWSSPLDVVDISFAQAIVQLSEFLLLSKRTISEREIELWIKHLKPVWKQSMEIMEAALVAWHHDMHAEGLISDRDDMEKFIIKGL